MKKTSSNQEFCQGHISAKLYAVVPQGVKCRGTLTQPLAVPGPRSHPHGFCQGCSALPASPMGLISFIAGVPLPPTCESIVLCSEHHVVGTTKKLLMCEVCSLNVAGSQLTAITASASGQLGLLCSKDKQNVMVWALNVTCHAGLLAGTLLGVSSSPSLPLSAGGQACSQAGWK